MQATQVRGRRLEENIETSKIVRELSPQRLYSKSPDQYKIQVPILFRDSKQLRYLRPIRNTKAETPEQAEKKPRLLRRLEALLESKLAAAEKTASQYGPMRATWAASMLRLDAYRQVFEALTNSMTTYKPMLMKIMRQYDAALEEALKASYENIHMRASLAVADMEQSKAVDAALTESAENALQLRDELYKQLADTEANVLKAEREAAEAEAAAKDARSQLSSLQRKALTLQKDKRRLQNQIMQKSSFAGSQAQS